MHRTRVLGLAAFDVLGTLAAAWLASRLLGWRFWLVCVALLGLAILVHRVFCVNTAVSVWLFGRV